MKYLVCIYSLSLLFFTGCSKEECVCTITEPNGYVFEDVLEEGESCPSSVEYLPRPSEHGSTVYGTRECILE